MPTTSAPDTGSRAARTGSRSSKQAPPSTLVLLIRHGTTPTTGKVLPGRAPGLHLAETGLEQAAAVAERLRAWSAAGSEDGRPATSHQASSKQASKQASSHQASSHQASSHQASSHQASSQQANGRQAKAPARPRVTAVYASPLERTRETAAPIAKALGLRVQTHRGLLECDFGEWTGAELKDLMKRPEWSTVQRYPSGFRFPGGESFTGMQARIVDALGDLCRRHPGQAIVAVSHADPIKAAVADALGSHLDLFQRIVISPCSLTAISYGSLGPVVLAVNSTSALSDLVPS